MRAMINSSRVTVEMEHMAQEIVQNQREPNLRGIQWIQREYEFRES
jgi:hypothetical protein